MPTPTMVGGQTRPPSSITLSMTKRFTAFTPSAGMSICRKEPFSEPEPFGIISISTVSSRSSKSTWMIGTPGPHEVCSFWRVIGCTTEERSGCSRVARSQPRRIASFSATPSKMHVLADGDVVDRDAGVLAQKIAGALGDRDVLDHGAENGAAGRVGLAPLQLGEALLHVARQKLHGADIERLADLLDFMRVEFHREFLTSRRCQECSKHSGVVCTRTSSRFKPLQGPGHRA